MEIEDIRPFLEDSALAVEQGHVLGVPDFIKTFFFTGEDIDWFVIDKELPALVQDRLVQGDVGAEADDVRAEGEMAKSQLARILDFDDPLFKLQDPAFLRKTQRGSQDDCDSQTGKSLHDASPFMICSKA
jgi:uncharacterized protein (DUF924 family)